MEEEAWLLTSPKTEEYDLLEVAGDWRIWLGKIETTKVSIACNECDNAADCNLNGQCVDGVCKCKESPEVSSKFMSSVLNT